MRKKTKYNKYDLIRKLSESQTKISEINKDIISVTIELDFADNDYDDPGLKIKTLKPNDDLFYYCDCLNETCTIGFFNFKDIIFSAIKYKKTEIGELTCKGFEEEGNTNYTCGCKVKYKITAKFIEVQNFPYLLKYSLVLKLFEIYFLNQTPST